MLISWEIEVRETRLRMRAALLLLNYAHGR